MTAANPTGPRALMMSEANKFKQDLLDCLEEHGPLSNVAICNLLGCMPVKSRSKLCRMMSEGLIHSRLVAGPNSPTMAIYALGVDESRGNKEVRQRIVTKWKSSTPAPDPVLAAFYGIQQQ